MSPQLIFIAGPLKGTVFDINEDEIFIGRDLSSRLLIMDKSLSRQHCLIKRDGGHFKIVDLNSHNGTFVNEVPIKEHLLAHEDRIQVGSSFCFFLLHADESLPATPAVRFDKGTLATDSAIILKPEMALYTMARDLNTLVKISTAINSLRSLTALQKQLVESIFEIVPAQRAAVVLVHDGLEEPDSVFVLNRLPDAAEPFRVSRTVAQQVLKEKVAILSEDVGEQELLNKSDSLLAARVSALMCVPLVIADHAIGFIYLDTHDPATTFTKWHLQILTAISSFAAGMLSNASQLERFEKENERLHAIIQEEHSIVGESERMREVYRFIAKASPTNATVLILGESGTGKELVARAIHHKSLRNAKPFIAVNCATLTETLLESELFGHEKGAFTGAIADKRGKLEVADGGTVFLDEVSEMSTSIQAKLLRVLQEREFERVGGTRTIKADLRIVAATNRDLDKAIESGEFRKDLYYRLNVISLKMPPLRERREDILLLAQYLIAKYSRKCNRRVEGLSPEARQCLLNYDWPGNVRELENAIERAIVLGSSDYIQPEDLPEAVLEVASAAGEIDMKYYESLQEAKKQIVIKALAQTNGSYKEAARLLGLHPNNLHRLIRNLNLKPSLSK